MKKTILVAAVAGLSVLAVAQADKSMEAKQPDSAAREASTGKASGKASYDIKKMEGAKQVAPQGQGKVAPDKMEAGAEGVKKTAEVSSGNPSKTSAQDDWQTQRVATGDVNGDGKASVKAPRDAASGMASGKRQHQPLLVNKAVDEKAPEQPKK